MKQINWFSLKVEKKGGSIIRTRAQSHLPYFRELQLQKSEALTWAQACKVAGVGQESHWRRRRLGLAMLREGNTRSAKEPKSYSTIELESYDAFELGFLLINSVNKQLIKIKRVWVLFLPFHTLLQPPPSQGVAGFSGVSHLKAASSFDSA